MYICVCVLCVVLCVLQITVFGMETIQTIYVDIISSYNMKPLISRVSCQKGPICHA